MTFNNKFYRKRKGRKPNKVCLVFCEGKSEELYFKYLGNKHKKSINCKLLQHKNFKGIAEEIEKEKSNLGLNDSDDIYCVIDKDNHTLKEFNNDYKNIEQNSEIIFSSKSFEVRILMHFSRFEKEVQKVDDYRELINGKMIKNFFYQKGINNEIRKPYSKEIREALDEKIKDAVNNSEYISKKQLQENQNNKFKCEPYTDIGHLVKIIAQEKKLKI